MKKSLVISIFLTGSLVFPILLFSSISLHWSLRMSFLSLLAILWNSAFTWVYLSFSPLPLASLLFIAICKASSDNHFTFLHVFFLEMVLIPVSCTMSWTSAHSSSGTLPIRSNPLNLFITSLAPPIRTRPSFSLSQSLPSGSLQKLILLHRGVEFSHPPKCGRMFCDKESEYTEV